MNSQPTYKIAEETFVLPNYQDFGPGLLLPVNAMLIRGKEPVLIDTVGLASREGFFEALWHLVEPKDLRWVFITHDDGDHLGNLEEVLALAPNATAVVSWNLVAKMLPIGFDVPKERQLWVGHGESFSAGDRTLHAIRPPAYDSPTTRGLFDSKTGVYFSSDCFGCPMPRVVEDQGELDPEYHDMGLHLFNAINHPWVQSADQAKFDQGLNLVAALDAKVIASGHGPAAVGQTTKLIEMLRIAPSKPPASAALQKHLDMLVRYNLPLELGALLQQGEKRAIGNPFAGWWG